MTADKPEAGRTCKPWCDTFASAYPVKSYCSDECKAACRPLNPARRPVETFAPLPDDEFRRAIRDGEEAGRRAMRRQALDEGRPPPIESPLPVERCSCDDARTMAVLKELMPNAAGAAEKIAALRQALKEIAQIPQGSQGAYGKFARASNIARRALALGGETET